jgi:hypothetical protein
LLWRYYYAIKKNNYLKASIILIATFSIFAVILNIEGGNCLSKINSLINEQESNNTAQTQTQTQQQQQSESQQNENENEMRESVGLINYCFLVTNLYVYSLFGIIIGIIIIAIWYMKYKKIWSNLIKRNR